MGTPPQEFKARADVRTERSLSGVRCQVIFDTGSGNLILPTASCKSDGHLGLKMDQWKVVCLRQTDLKPMVCCNMSLHVVANK